MSGLAENNYQKVLVEAWEEVHKKSQLTLWILLSLVDGPKSMAQIKDFIINQSATKFLADNQSMYRALRRYDAADLVKWRAAPSPNGGPEQKIFQLTATGKSVLGQFVERNIISIYYNNSIRKLIERTV